MDDSNQPYINNRAAVVSEKSDEPIPERMPFGLSGFGQKEREAFGRDVRLAMSCIEGTTQPKNVHAIPFDEPTIRHRLKVLSQEITSNHADLLELLVRFDDLEGWKSTGASHCAAWMNTEIGIGIRCGWEYLRVGRKLRVLPTLRSLFRVGKLSWSKVRLISRVANEDNEKFLCHAALDAAVSDVERICQGYRWQDDDNSGNEAENNQAMQQWTARSLTWDKASNGNTRIQLSLPPEIAQVFLKSVEHSLNQLEPSDCKLSQRRADAAVLMAEQSLQCAGKEIATADRYQVIVSIDESALSTANTENAPIYAAERTQNIPTKRPTIQGAGPVATDTARRIACDCMLTTIKTANGEPIDIGRKSRIWPAAMARAIKERDQGCVWPGCTQSHHLHIHHIKHWADGGTTSVSNGASLCSHHHTLVHEGGYSIQRVDNNKQRQHEQFIQQLRTADISQFDFETNLRTDNESFNKVRKLSPASYRFRVVDTQGQDILKRDIIENDSLEQPNPSGSDEAGAYTTPFSPRADECTRVQCNELLGDSYNGGSIAANVAYFSHELAPNYEKPLAAFK